MELTYQLLHSVVPMKNIIHNTSWRMCSTLLAYESAGLLGWRLEINMGDISSWLTGSRLVCQIMASREVALLGWGVEMSTNQRVAAANSSEEQDLPPCASEELK